jgi:hypothetical protein
MRVRIVRLCFCGRPTKRPNAVYCSGAHADVAYRRRRELSELLRLVDVQVERLRSTTRRIHDLIIDADALPGGPKATRPTSLFRDRMQVQIRRDVASHIQRSES